MPTPPVVVYPPDEEGGRRVRCNGQILGRAFTLYDVTHLLNQAGLNTAATAFEDTSIFEWRGGSPYAWEPSGSGPDGTAD
jgi:hypothetical protein